jgi:hypothetical protein
VLAQKQQSQMMVNQKPQIAPQMVNNRTALQDYLAQNPTPAPPQLDPAQLMMLNLANEYQKTSNLKQQMLAA